MIWFLATTDAAGVTTISKHIGYNTAGISCIHTTGGLYEFTHPAHPNGAQFLLMLSPYSSSTTTVTTIPTGYGLSSAKGYVYCKSAGGAITNINGNFYKYSVP